MCVCVCTHAFVVPYESFSVEGGDSSKYKNLFLACCTYHVSYNANLIHRQTRIVSDKSVDTAVMYLCFISDAFNNSCYVIYMINEY